MSETEQPWEAKAAAKRAAILAQIPPEWRLEQGELDKASQQSDLTGEFIEQYLSPEEISITHESSTSLVGKIARGELSSVQVAQAFCKAAAIAQQIGNCLHEMFFDQALQRAKELDEHYATHGKTVGPLHGLPVSLKDQFHVKGVETTMGFVGWIDTFEGKQDPTRFKNVNSQLTSELLSLGAVLYCKTSVPQTLLIGETANRIIGQTVNPQNQNLSCGGSSGGEGALLALRGSSVGFGTDIGGSVRIPAAFNGVFSLKPSYNRLSYRDVANTIPGELKYSSSIGVLGTTLDALQLALSSVLSTEPWLRDPSVPPIPWRQHVVDETLSRTKLKLGIFWSNGMATPHPPVTRALRIVVDAVKAAGHKVVEWNPPSHAEAVRIHTSVLLADGAHDVHTQLDLSGEPILPELKELLTPREPSSVVDYHALMLQGRDYEAAYSDYWNSTSEDDGQVVDAVIMPVAPHAAVIPGKYYSIAYTQAINLLNYSAVVIPVTKADKSKDIADDSYQPLGDLDRLNWNAYDAEIYDGAPVGIQIVARKFEEEKIWAIGKRVYELLQSETKNGV